MKKKFITVGTLCLAGVMMIGAGIAVSAHGNGIMIFHGKDGKTINLQMTEELENDLKTTDKEAAKEYQVGDIIYENGYKQEVIGISDEGAILLQNLEENE